MGFALGVEAPTAVVKHTIDEVIRLVTDETLKVPDQASHRRQLLEETIGHSSILKKWPNVRSPPIGKAGEKTTIMNLSIYFERFSPIRMLEKLKIIPEKRLTISRNG
jgi:hypothetical protein